MGADTKIPWATHTFNPWWGCVHHGPECASCYACAWAKRTGHDVWGPDKPRRFFGEKHWREPLKWNDAAEKSGVRARVFVASMSDLYERLPDGHPQIQEMNWARDRLHALIEATSWLDWMLLTKRIENVEEMSPEHWVKNGFPVNVWIGTTAGTQKSADERVPILCRIPAAVRFISVEPMLEPIDLDVKGCDAVFSREAVIEDSMRGPIAMNRDQAEAVVHYPQIHLVIAGCEKVGNKPGRPMKDEWVRSLRAQCEAAGVAFFLKQAERDGRVVAMPELDGHVHDAMPEVPR